MSFLERMVLSRLKPLLEALATFLEAAASSPAFSPAAVDAARKAAGIIRRELAVLK